MTAGELDGILDERSARLEARKRWYTRGVTAVALAGIYQYVIDTFLK